MGQYLEIICLSCIAFIHNDQVHDKVFYLHSLNLGEITMHHDILSRIKAFNKIMRIVIIADCSRCISNRSEVDFGASKVY